MAVNSTMFVPSLAPQPSHPWLNPHAASIAVFHGHLVGWPVTRKAIPLPISLSQEVQPPPKCQYNTPGLCSTRLRLWQARSTAPWATPTPRSSTALLLSAHPARLTSLLWHCSPALLCLACRDGNFHILKLKHQAPQSDARQSAGRRWGLAHSAPPPLPLPACSSTNAGGHCASHPLCPEVLGCSFPCTSVGWNQLLPSYLWAHSFWRIILSVFYLLYFLLSQLPDSWLWIQAAAAHNWKATH